MVLQVDLTKTESNIEKKYTDTERIRADQPPKIGLKKKLKNKMRKWKANFTRIPLTQKLFVLFIIISLTSLISVAVIYSYVLITTPGHRPLDTTYKLIEVQALKSYSFDLDLPLPPQVKDQENPINGELYTKEEYETLQSRKPLLVMIENHIDARPQAGLSNADLVYETLVESGITRFMAVFWGKDAEKVGPVRSIRTYFIDWSAEYDDPPICNIGQAGYESWEAVIVPEADARSYIRRYNVKSFGWYGRNVTWRDRDKFNSGIAWEHVAYSDTETLWDDAATLGWTGPSTFDSFNFKKEMLKEQRPISQEIELKFLNLSPQNYRVKWTYDKDSNTYKRYLADIPHTDENNDKQISAKNVIIQHCKYRPTGDRNGRIVYTTIDEGQADIFRDGEHLEGTWKKENRTSRTKFYVNDEEVELNRGQIWIEIVPVSGTTDLSDITIK